MPEENFKAAMMRMCDPKVRLLNKEIKKPIFNDNEKISVNAAYKSPSIKVNLIPVKKIVKKEAKMTEEEEKAQKQVTKERTFVIQAHVVKVMKAQKNYRFLDLQTDVIRNITMFRAEPKMIKEQIEYLIQNEYMKRDETNKGMLIYLP